MERRGRGGGGREKMVRKGRYLNQFGKPNRLLTKAERDEVKRDRERIQQEHRERHRGYMIEIRIDQTGVLGVYSSTRFVDVVKDYAISKRMLYEEAFEELVVDGIRKYLRESVRR